LRTTGLLRLFLLIKFVFGFSHNIYLFILFMQYIILIIQNVLMYRWTKKVT